MIDLQPGSEIHFATVAGSEKTKVNYLVSYLLVLLLSATQKFAAPLL